ncbi:hypothetical protein BSKO_06323 [Bryopsis sp. KO-2023]|nr:hypothetical protein BSKO_06323 [Bryopsis sp. KO-2023]
MEVKKETKEGIMADVVVFDVGGQRFSTTLHTLQRYPESFLPEMCRDCHDAVGTGKEIHIDRSSAGFAWIIEIYRGCPIKITQSIPSDWGLGDLENELNFYQLPAPDQLWPLFHGELLLRREKKALKRLGDEMLAAMSAKEGCLYLKDYAGFCVRLVEDESREEALKTIFLGQDMSIDNVENIVLSSVSYKNGSWLPSSLNVSSIGRRIWRFRGVSFMTLRDNQLKVLKDHFRKFGFGVSQTCGSSGSPGVIPMLTVGWREQ